MIEVTKDGCKKIASLYFNKLILDGNMLVPKDSSMILSRASFSHGCIIALIALIKHNNETRFLHNVHSIGVFDNQDNSLTHLIKRKLRQLIITHITEESAAEIVQKSTINQIKNELNRIIFKERGISPKIFVSILSEHSAKESLPLNKNSTFISNSGISSKL